MSRFLRYSKRTGSRPKPIQQRYSKCDAHHDQFRAMHLCYEHSSEGKTEQREEFSRRKAKRAAFGKFSSQRRQRGNDSSIHEKPRNRGERRVPPEVSTDREQNQHHCKNHNGQMRCPEPRMNGRKKRRKVSALSHRESDARCVQHIRAEIAVYRNQRAHGDESNTDRAEELPRGIHRWLCRCARIRQRVNHDDLHANIKQSRRDHGDQERDRRILPWIACFARSEQRRFKSSVGINHQQDCLEAIRGRQWNRGRRYSHARMQRERYEPTRYKKRQEKHLCNRKEIAQCFSAAHAAIIYGRKKSDEHSENRPAHQSSIHGRNERLR